MHPLSIAQVAAKLQAHTPISIPAEVAPARAAVACILRQHPAHASCELLLIRRATAEGDPWSGHMALPGGRMEPVDESELATAVRETREEIGLELDTMARLLGRLDDVRASARGRVLPLAISPFVFELIVPAEPGVSSEVEEAIWAPVPTLLSPASRSTVAYELPNQRFELPAIDVAGRTVWGLTYQMLMRFFATVDWPYPHPTD